MLVSIQITTPTMEICDSNNDSVNAKTPKKVNINCALSENIVLCEHCKRTASNGIRCLGMCVADNDY